MIEPIGMGGELLLKAIHSLGYYAIIASTEHDYHSMLQNSKAMIDDTIFINFSARENAIETMVNESKRKGVAGVVVAWEFLTNIAAEVA